MFALMVGTLALIAAIIFAQSLTKPIDVLVGGMKNVATGDLNTHIKIQSNDEIRVLGDSFNHMISDLKESRQKLEEINRDLEDKVKERTLQLEKQNQAVKSAQEALLRTTRLAAVGEIAGRAAHEVLNPLTSILSRVQKVKRRLEDKKDAELNILSEISSAWKDDFDQGGFDKLVETWKKPSEVLEQKTLWDEDLENLGAVTNNLQNEWNDLLNDTQFLVQESERINRIVQSMRGLSIVKSEKRHHSISELLENAKNVMADYASKDGVEIELSFPKDEIYIAADKDEFLQSITNLIRNSVQAIVEKRQEGHLSKEFIGKISIAVKSSGDETVQIYLEDNGIGILAENHSKLFESQFTTKPRKEGTGLGLNISRRFIRAVGGDIQLEKSEPGIGSVFKVVFPIDTGSGEKVPA